MYLDPTYSLQEIAEVPYLLPFGQGIPMFHHQLRLNQTGSMIWDMLKDMENLPEMSLEDIASFGAEEICKRAALPESEKGDVKEDLRAFLTQLQKLGILLDEQKPLWEKATPVNSLFQADLVSEGESVLTIGIAGIKINLCGNPGLFSKELFSFQVSEEKEAVKDELCFSFLFAEKKNTPGGVPLLECSDFRVYEYIDGYQIFIPVSGRISSICLSKDGASARFYLNGSSENCDARMKYDVFHAVRFAFSYAAMLRGHFLIHSVSIQYQGRAWLFSAPSGTGKSTHADLWTRLYGDEVRILNGDVNLLSVTEGIPMVHGIPWNGTSDIYTTEAVPLGGVIFLQRGKTDVLEPLSAEERILSLIRRFLSPNWTEELLIRHINFAEKLEPEIYLRALSCTMNPSAAKLLRQDIDRFLNHRI